MYYHAAAGTLDGGAGARERAAGGLAAVLPHGALFERQAARVRARAAFRACGAGRRGTRARPERRLRALPLYAAAAARAPPRSAPRGRQPRSRRLGRGRQAEYIGSAAKEREELQVSPCRSYEYIIRKTKLGKIVVNN